MPAWLEIVCILAAAVAAAYLTYVIVRPERF
jgi:hypothetical protein